LAITEDGDCFGWGSNGQLQLSHEKDFSRMTNPLLASFTPIRIIESKNYLFFLKILTFFFKK
jgi:alpha-tubulin suppressor-like RCC1 family protein